MKTTETTLRKLANDSGFLFQLAVEDAISSDKEIHKWEVAVREHPWANPEDGEEGFIDLVLQQDFVRLVIECKRRRDGVWLFLVPKSKRPPKQEARCLWTHFEPGHRDLFSWDDFLVSPDTPQSEFCVIRGHGEDSKPLLEQLAGHLLSSLSALAVEELALIHNQSYNEPKMLVPMIVTTAELYVCEFAAADVSLDTGATTSGEFKSVPFVRFRKSLSTTPTASTTTRTLAQANRDKQRTIFVINASHISDFLQHFELRPPAPYPWIEARRKEEQR